MEHARVRRIAALPYTVMLVVLLGATTLRALRFDQWPPGLSYDEAVNGIDAVNLGSLTLMPPRITDNGRSELLFSFLLIPTVHLIGPTRFGLRIASLFLGVLAVAAAYRAGRHAAPLGSPARPWAGVLAAGVLAVMVGHIHLSRVSYRGILLPFILLLFVDAFIAAWEHGRRRDFALAGMWLGLCIMSYAPGLVAPIIAAVATLHQAILRRRQLRDRWRGLLAFGLVCALIFGAQAVLLIVQPSLYHRVGEMNRFSLPLGEQIAAYLRGMSSAWSVMGRSGDVNPQYNVAETPLLHTAFLYGLLLIGMAACVLRPRRAFSVLGLGLLFGMLLPNAMAGEMRHGLRIVGEYAAVPLVVAASLDALTWPLIRFPAQPRLQLAQMWLLGLFLASCVIWGGARSWQIYADYFRSDVRWGQGGAISAFSWFFETRRLAMAEFAAQHEGVVYVPLTEARHPSMRYFTLRQFPRVTTFAAYFPSGGPLTLRPGVFLIPPDAEDLATFVAFMPDGTLVLLPRLEEDTVVALREAAASSNWVLRDAYGEVAAALVEFPPNGNPLVLERPVAHPLPANFGNQVSLVGWDAPLVLPDDDYIHVTLYFAPGDVQRHNVFAFIQLWDHGFGWLASGEEIIPNRWLYTPEQWKPQDVVPVVLYLPVPEGLEWGAYDLAIGVSDFRHHPIPILTDSGEASEVAVATAFKVPQPPPPFAYGAWNIAFGETAFQNVLALMSYEVLDQAGKPIDTVQPGQPLSVVLHWKAFLRPDADYTLFVHVVDSAGTLIAQNDSQPLGGRYPTSVWSPGEAVITTHPIDLPAQIDGPITLYAGMYLWPTMEHPIAWQAGGSVWQDGRAPLTQLPVSNQQ